jgi:hypothetical protein
LLTVLILLLLLAVGEAIARTQAFQSRLSAPSLGGRNIYLEIQWHALQSVVRREGRLRCIALGNSMVWGGFDPTAFSQGYRDQVRTDLPCYNFGIDGLPASAAGVLADILVRDFQPDLLIYGIDARDFAVPSDAPDATSVLDMPWVRYRQGKFSVEGWLYAHSNLYGYRNHLRHLLRFNYSDARPREVEYRIADHYGFNPDDTVGSFVGTPPNPGDAQGQVDYYFSVLSEYQVRPENVAGLEQVLNQAGQTQVLVVALPVPETYFGFFSDPETDYRRFLDAVSSRAAAHGVPFWTSTPQLQIPVDGWVDYSHLNTEGASLFSNWLGRQIGQGVAQGALEGPNR